jgi:hypothetical protein
MTTDSAEKSEIEKDGKAGAGTATALHDAAWYRLFAKDFQGALAAAAKALSIQSDKLSLATNKAHATG